MTLAREQGSKEQVEGAVTIGFMATVHQATLVALQAQSILLNATETLTVNWLRRRREAALDAQRVVEQLPSCRSMAAALQLQQEWVRAVGQRLVDDAVGPLGSAATRATAGSSGHTRVVPSG